MRTKRFEFNSITSSSSSTITSSLPHPPPPSTITSSLPHPPLHHPYLILLLLLCAGQHIVGVAVLRGGVAAAAAGGGAGGPTGTPPQQGEEGEGGGGRRALLQFEVVYPLWQGELTQPHLGGEHRGYSIYMINGAVMWVHSLLPTGIRELLKALDHYINARLLLFLNTGCGWAGYVILRIQKTNSKRVDLVRLPCMPR